MSKLDSLQNKLDMWQRICTMYGTNNLTLTPSDVVQLRQEVAVLYARIAELEKALNIDTDLTIAGLRKELRDATARIAELEMKIRHNALWQASEDAEERAHLEKLVLRIAELERDCDMLFRSAANKQSRKNTVSQTFVYGKERE